ncbi:hypothetical protein RJT34_25611 [Clitoria ternatea]|uniref:Uncharacterized protein n=1 Tax=Clitoria ternatea TaxID=43366 RepID=A0AAN9FQA2_CLITE
MYLIKKRKEINVEDLIQSLSFGLYMGWVDWDKGEKREREKKYVQRDLTGLNDKYPQAEDLVAATLVLQVPTMGEAPLPHGSSSTAVEC